MSVKQFNIETHQEVHHYNVVHDNHISANALKTNRKYLFVASPGNSVKQFNIETHQEVHHYKGVHDGYICAFALTSDGKYLFTASYDKTVKQFDVENHQEVYHYPGIFELDIKGVFELDTLVISLTSDGRYLFTNCFNNGVKQFNT